MKCRIFLISLLCPALFLSSCGKSFEEVRAPYLRKFQALQEKLTEVKLLIEAIDSNSPREDGADLSPAIKLIKGEPEQSNCDHLMFDHLDDITLNLSQGEKMDLYLGGPLKSALGYMGKYEDLSAVLTDRGIKAAEETRWHTGWDATLRTRYLIVSRQGKYLPAKAVGGAEFEMGAIEFDHFVFNFESTPKLVGSFTTLVKSDQDVKFSYREGEDPAVALEICARSNLWTKTRERFSSKLLDLFPGSVFQL